MPTLVTADLHLAANPRDEYRFDFLERTLRELVKAHDVERVLVLGDVCEAVDAHRAPLVNRIVDGFAKLAHSAPVIVLRGNHDYVREDVPFFRFLSHVDNVRWINEPTVLRLGTIGRCALLPYTRDVSTWASLLLNDEPCSWFFCHQPFRGAALGNGRTLEHGVRPPFPRGARVVSGDIHAPQRVGPVTYVGAPYTVDFGDDYEPRILLLDGRARDRVMTSVPVEGRQKRLVEAVVAAPDELDAASGVRPGDVVKVRVQLQKDATPADARRLAREWARDVGVNLAAVQVVAPATRVTGTKTTGVKQRTDEDLVRGYVKKMRRGKATLRAGMKIVEG